MGGHHDRNYKIESPEARKRRTTTPTERPMWGTEIRKKRTQLEPGDKSEEVRTQRSGQWQSKKGGHAEDVIYDPNRETVCSPLAGESAWETYLFERTLGTIAEKRRDMPSSEATKESSSALLAIIHWMDKQVLHQHRQHAPYLQMHERIEKIAL